MNRAQLPASLRAVDTAADVFQNSARGVGVRVYGHPGGLAAKERYKLAEKREIFLRNTRNQSEEEPTRANTAQFLVRRKQQCLQAA